MNFGQHIASKLAADAEAYGVPSSQAEAFISAFNAFEAAYRVAMCEATRTKPAVRDKDTKKRAFVTIARRTIAQVQAWEGMTNEKRAKLNIPERKDHATRIARPEEEPRLLVTKTVGRAITVRVKRPEGERGRPKWARGVWLYRSIGDAMPENTQSMEVVGQVTGLRTRLTVGPHVPPGTKVWLAAAWVSPTGERGPACNPVATWTNHLTLAEAAV